MGNTQNRPTATAQPVAEQPQSSPGMLVLALAGTVIFMGFYYHVLALNQMRQLAGGMPMLDHRPFGYRLDEVEAVATAMDDPALGQLNWTHKTAGVIFPVLVALLAVVVAFWALRSWVPRSMMIATGVVFAVVDMWENTAIEQGLREVTQQTVSLASALTIGRWVLLVLLAVGVIVAIFRKIVTSTRASEPVAVH
ncbi:hypothetical protein [Auritidibacter ignavus]|uniref:hypothetical protein n=1 Tax=Auritidibacter ignavus TaxID=678932 RepID=UPI0024498F67|nr:hypothetical protein [Auritidibacter ignavus]WGH84990.1 hypothetical protein QDX20_05650 [Auritidibacter ignavus]